MKPIKFKEQNCIIAENQEPYIPLPAHKDEDGLVISCWKLSFIEWIQIIFTGKMYLGILTFNKPLQPIKCTIRNLFNKEK